MQRRVIRNYVLTCLAAALLFCIARQLVLLSTTSSGDGGGQTGSGRQHMVSSGEQRGKNDLKVPHLNVTAAKLQQPEVANGGGKKISPAKKTSPPTVQIIGTTKRSNTTPSRSVSGTTAGRRDVVAAGSYPKLFGTGCTDSRHLGLPKYVRIHCVGASKNKSSTPSSRAETVRDCDRLTCFNLLTTSLLKDRALNQTVSTFTKKFVDSVPSDEYLAKFVAAIASVRKASNLTAGPTGGGGGAGGDVRDDACTFWRKSYSFDDLPPTSADELDFPLAYNILAHKFTHQVSVYAVKCIHC